MAKFTESGMNTQSYQQRHIMQCLSFITFMLSQTISALLWTLMEHPLTFVLNPEEKKKKKRVGGGRKNNNKQHQQQLKNFFFFFWSHLDTVCRHLCSENTDHSARWNSQRGVARSHYTGRIGCLRLQSCCRNDTQLGLCMKLHSHN